jgi:hypothetical protein
VDSVHGWAVVTVTASPGGNQVWSRRPPPPSNRIWIPALLDVMAVAWMIPYGSWLDDASRLTSVITLGGHHQVVTALAVTSFVILAVLAVMTEGFSEWHALDSAVLSLAGGMTVVATAGILSIVVLVILVGLTGRLFVR